MSDRTQTMQETELAVKKLVDLAHKLKLGEEIDEGIVRDNMKVIRNDPYAILVVYDVLSNVQEPGICRVLETWVNFDKHRQRKIISTATAVSDYFVQPVFVVIVGAILTVLIFGFSGRMEIENSMQMILVFSNVAAVLILIRFGLHHFGQWRKQILVHTNNLHSNLKRL